MIHLVTGAAGFIGFHLSQRLLGRGDKVVGVDSINDSYDPGLKMARLAELGIGPLALEWGLEASSEKAPGFSFIRLSLEDQEGMEKLFAGRRFDRVCHLAAQAGVRYSLVNPRAYVSANVQGFLNVLECCRTARVPHLVYASSSSVYGQAPQPSSPRDRADHPISIYAATKRTNELMSHVYSHLYGLPTTGLRFFTVYGPWGRPDMAYFKFARAILDDTPIEVFNEGNMSRDFTYIDDAVEGILRVMDSIPSVDPDWSAAHGDPAGSRAPYRLYNIGNSKPELLSDFIATLESVLGKKASKRFLPLQPGDVQSTCADTTELERCFGWKPETGIREGLRKFAEWLVRYKGR